MLHIDVTLEDFAISEEAFDENWQDWCLGGPKTGGWTRTGVPFITGRVGIKSLARRKWLSPTNVLAKNLSEVLQWHVGYLQSPSKDSPYFKEYLCPRMSEARAEERSAQFLSLFKEMRASGYNPSHPAKVADVTNLGMSFCYFRFDGCHRTACAYVLGIKTIPVDVFSIWFDSAYWT